MNVVSRVLLIIPTLDRGGAEKQLTLLAVGLRQTGWDVHVCCLTRGGPYEKRLAEAGVPVTIIGKPWKLDPFALLRLRRYIRKLQPDLVHTWLFPANSYGRTAALACGVQHVVAGERCVDPWKRTCEFAIDRWLGRRTERIATNSSGVVDFYVQHGIARDKFVVIPNGIEVSDVSPTYARSDLFQELGLPADAIVVGAVGRLWPQKRYKDLLWSLDLLRCFYDHIHFLIIGDGPQRWRLERYARQLTNEHNVHFLGERGDVAQILPHLDVFWLGSGYEGQSNSLLEAMLTGVPAVATDIPGNRDLVEDGRTGFLVPVGDRAGFASRTRELIENPALRTKLGQAAREHIRQTFSVEQMVKRHAALYHSLIDR